MTTSTPSPKAPVSWGQRMGMAILTLIFTALLWWLVGFVQRDIASMPRPDLSDTPTIQEQRALEGEIKGLDRTISRLESNERHLRESTAASKDTLNQLLGSYRSEDDRAQLKGERAEAVAESEQRFLKNQDELQAVIAELHEMRDQRTDTQERLDDIKHQASIEYQAAMRKHRNKVAMLRTAALLPFLLLGVWFTIKWRKGIYAPLLYAFDAAVFLHLMMLIHEYFPSRYYKYIFIALALAVVATVLVKLIRAIRRPSKERLLQRYREAYALSKCPCCGYGIIGDNLRSIVPDKRLLRRKASWVINADDTAAREYTCPACGTQVFARCDSCQNIRHTHLPHCVHCGDVSGMVG